jgi:CheY-like chemotaxis protein
LVARQTVAGAKAPGNKPIFSPHRRTGTLAVVAVWGDMAIESTLMKTILLVEDNAVAREGLTVLLRQHGFLIIQAEHGEEALNYLRNGPPPDLILLDMLMPVLDGWHFLGYLKGIEKAASIPIIVTTGTILTREWTRENGCAGFVHKPIELDALLEEIRRCLESARSKEPE